ncbi:MAG: zf-HC2 domain-containing protein [Elusimicrobiota bacterium]
MIMNCHAAQAVFDLHAEGRLTPRRAKSVDAHLASCARCRALSAPTVSPVKPASPDFKARLAAALKSKTAAAARAEPPIEERLWPRDLSSVAVAALALTLLAVCIGWSGVPSQWDAGNDELAAGRIP